VNRVGIIAASLALLLGCGRDNSPRRPKPAPEGEARKNATVIEYLDTDAFDHLLEAALNRQDPIVVVQTAHSKPDWEGRLNAWIAAWNEGGKVEKEDNLFLKSVSILAKSATPNASKVVVIELPPDTAKETRKLVQGEIDRIERVAREAVEWWRDEQKRAKRIALLKPYLFIFEKDVGQKYQIIFYK
jgi:hypothetical protein